MIAIDDVSIREDAIGGAAVLARQFEGDWNGLVGRRIEIYDRGTLTDSGRVDAVTTDGQVLWLAQEGVFSRRIHERFAGRVVYVPRHQESQQDGRMTSTSAS